MKKSSVLLIALVATIALGGIAADAAKKAIKVNSTVTLTFDPGGSTDPDDPYAEATFRGRVGARGSAKAKRKCKRGRTVIIKELGEGEVGRDKTNGKGRYAVPAGEIIGDEYDPPRDFRASVKRKKKGKYICKSAKTKVVTAP